MKNEDFFAAMRKPRKITSGRAYLKKECAWCHLEITDFKYEMVKMPHTREQGILLFHSRKDGDCFNKYEENKDFRDDDREEISLTWKQRNFQDRRYMKY